MRTRRSLDRGAGADTHALMSLYSGPMDSVLAPLSLLAPLDDLPLPEFSSHIAIELWEDSTDEDEDASTKIEHPGKSGPGKRGKGNTALKQKAKKNGAQRSHKPAAPAARFLVRLTYDGKLLESSTACPGGTCSLSLFLDNIQTETTTECKPVSYDKNIPTWDIDASCCKDA